MLRGGFNYGWMGSCKLRRGFNRLLIVRCKLRGVCYNASKLPALPPGLAERSDGLLHSRRGLRSRRILAIFHSDIAPLSVFCPAAARFSDVSLPGQMNMNLRYLGFLWVLFAQMGWSQDYRNANGSSWEETLTNGQGKVIVYWYPNTQQDNNDRDVMDGVEYELMTAFMDYLYHQYHAKVTLEWRKSADFNDVLERVSKSRKGVFGSSSISITPERREILAFSPPYFPDICVMVSNDQMPIAKTREEFTEMLKNGTAVTIANTTMEREILLLNDTRDLNATITYVRSGGEIISTVEQLPNSFGYVDLPNFLVSVSDATRVKRQYFYPLKLDGLSFIYPLGSDWEEPVNDYFNSEQFQKDKRRIVSKYLGAEVTDLIEKISRSAEFGPEEEILLLTEEKELQAQELLEVFMRDQERKRVTFLLTISVVFVLVIAFVLYLRIVTKSRANKQLEEKQKIIEQRNNQLTDINNEKNNLIRVVAHDLRNPVNQILGFSRLLLEDNNLGHEQRTMITFMQQSSERLREMVSKILDVDAIESGQRNLQIEPVAVDEVLGQVMQEFQEAAKFKDILMEMEGHAEEQVLADKVYYTQVLGNLVSNALKFSQRGTAVRLQVQSDGSSVTVSVADRGPGFTEEDQRRIFKKYQQLSARATAGEPSTGLGLSIVKMYTEMMGGTVTYKTAPGEGTTFFVSMPKVG